MKLIPEWRRAWRLLSVQAAAAAVAFGALPADTQSAILAALGIPLERVPALLGAIVIASRLLSQEKQR